jgi:hypothetical protein
MSNSGIENPFSPFRKNLNKIAEERAEIKEIEPVVQAIIDKNPKLQFANIKK